MITLGGFLMLKDLRATVICFFLCGVAVGAGVIPVYVIWWLLKTWMPIP